MNYYPSLCIILLVSNFGCLSNEAFHQTSVNDAKHWEIAADNGILVNEGLERCRNFVDGWLSYADPTSGLIPRNLENDKNIWNAKDAAADNYPFMVLTSAITDRVRFNTKMMQMLKTEKDLTSRVGQLPDTYNFDKRDFNTDEINMADIIFGSSEYIKDGLLPLTEWLGLSSWSDRMLDILDDIWVHANVNTPFGKIPSENPEVNGEMLQVLSRIYFMTGDHKYLEYAERLGDYYLLENHHPTRDFSSLRLRDHGCEVVSGLCELYAALYYENPEKKSLYKPQIHEMLHRILEVARNEDGLFYDVVNPQTGEVLRDRIADNFGYNLNGFYTVYQLDSVEEFRDAVIKALSVLNDNYQNFDWENGSADGYADAIEGALNLYNREIVASTSSWLDSQIKVMWSMQQPDGIIEGWHGDGNFARTTIMYCLWKTQGLTLQPWRRDLQLGAETSGDTLWISITCEKPWKGKIYFDQKRHKKILNLPFDWPRINQFPEWFTIDEDQIYLVLKKDSDVTTKIHSDSLKDGLDLDIGIGTHQLKVIDPGADESE